MTGTFTYVVRFPGTAYTERVYEMAVEDRRALVALGQTLGVHGRRWMVSSYWIDLSASTPRYCVDVVDDVLAPELEEATHAARVLPMALRDTVDGTLQVVPSDAAQTDDLGPGGGAA